MLSESLWEPLISLHLREPLIAAVSAVQHIIYFVIHVLSHILTMEAEEIKHVSLPSIPSVTLLASVAFSVTAVACSQIGIQVLLFATSPLGYRLSIWEAFSILKVLCGGQHCVCVQLQCRTRS